MKNKRLIFIFATVAVLLCIPLVAMQFDLGVNWDMTDFLVMGVLLTGTGLLCELALRLVKSTKTRLLICGIVIMAFLLIWIELAVGIFNSPFAGS